MEFRIAPEGEGWDQDEGREQHEYENRCDADENQAEPMRTGGKQKVNADYDSQNDYGDVQRNAKTGGIVTTHRPYEILL